MSRGKIFMQGSGWSDGAWRVVDYRTITGRRTGNLRRLLRRVDRHLGDYRRLGGLAVEPFLTLRMCCCLTRFGCGWKDIMLTQSR